jgi:hypothetical protein
VLEGKKMRAVVLLLAMIPCAASVSETFMAQSAGTGGTRDFGAAPQMVFPIRPRNEPATSTLFPLFSRIIHIRLWSG